MRKVAGEMSERGGERTPMRRGGEHMDVREVPNHVKGDTHLMERKSRREKSKPR